MKTEEEETADTFNRYQDVGSKNKMVAASYLIVPLMINTLRGLMDGSAHYSSAGVLHGGDGGGGRSLADPGLR